MSEQRRVLVTGATGATGRHVVDGLLGRGAGVRALVRRPESARLPDGVDLAEGDLTDAASVGRATKGIDAVYLLWPAFSSAGAAATVEALTGDAERVVYLSSMNVRDDAPPEVNGVWGELEGLVERSGAEWTHLRAGGFATNTLGWADQIRAGDVVRIPYPQAGRSLIHERDIAAVAVRALLDDGHAGRKHVLTGPQTLTQARQVGLIGAAIGRELRVEAISADEARRQAADELGDAGYVDAALGYWSTLTEHPEPVTNTVERITGRLARTFADWADEHADAFRS
jgi:uncharacterized protein YbjT (DUF2867 family)